ncbi:DUF4233 domain-containing protein [Gordonia sp. PKS22-38]|uniref:DUF4233 domain-containing protein n=1 Tax=Gordonia prachuapensis TaxID=3115651 RepID=A0ABU7MS77_9ACTN|nr:DUF4233 domain-containing protein [Gordonia sp. PKS22-38]
MSEPARYTPPTTDPWKGLRGVMAGTLILEVIVIGLAFPIVANLGPGITWLTGGYLGLVVVAFIAAAGMQGRPYALRLDLGLQAVVIAGGFLHWSVAVVGVIFLCVWVYIAYIKRDVEQRMAKGMLAGQEPLDD